MFTERHTLVTGANYNVQFRTTLPKSIDMFPAGRSLRILRPLSQVRCYGDGIKEALLYKKYHELLEVPQDCDQERLRRSYIELVKKYHPDNPDGGDVEKFQEIDKAFRVLMQRKSQERWDVEATAEVEAEQFDIKHTAPQHRQYLSYGGVGSGTPFQRQKQYAKMRAMQAASNVLQHRVNKVTADEKTLMDKKLPFKHKIKTKYGFDRLVEDLIQESMSKGEFNNLSGCGKPLKMHQDLNPYVDYTTHKINQVLIDNGFTPEWITLQKEIREDTERLRDLLYEERSYLGPHPLRPADELEWNDVLEKHRPLCEAINRKINKYNLVVPVLDKQKLLVDMEREAALVVRNGRFDCVRTTEKKAEEKRDGSGIFGVLSMFIK